MKKAILEIEYDEEAMDINEGFINGLYSDYLGIEHIKIISK